MKRSSAPYIDNPQWDDPEKIRSRTETIIKLYRRYFFPAVPANLQYWTLAGSYFNWETKYELKGELGQLTEVGLIREKQFHAVDWDAAKRGIIAKNKELHPSANWYEGDFYTVMAKEIVNGTFRPAIVNYDGTMLTGNAVPYVKKIIRLLESHVSNKLLLLLNFPEWNPYKKGQVFSGADTAQQLIREMGGLEDCWEMFPKYFEYPGSGKKSQSTMSILPLIKTK